MTVTEAPETRTTLRASLPYLLLFPMAFIAFAMATRLGQPMLVDEATFHLPAVDAFIRQWPHIDIRTYGGVAIASGPVPYVVWAGWGKLLGVPASAESIEYFRIVSLLFALVALGVLWAMSRDVPPSTRVVVVGLVCTMPYFFLHSFTIYTHMIAATLAISSLAAYQAYARDGSVGTIALAAVLAALAVASRQIYVSYAAGMLAHQGLRFWSDERRQTTRYVRDVALLLIPLVTLLALFSVWGGTVPPLTREGNASTGINLLQPNFALIFLGFWFLPVWVTRLRAVPRGWIALAVLVALNLLVAPDYATEQSGAILIEGVLPKAFSLATEFGVPAFLVRAAQVVAAGGGVIVLYLTVRRVFERRDEAYLGLAALAHLGLLMVVPQVWERFYLPIVPLLWLLFRRDLEAKWMPGVWLAGQVLITSGYVFYKLYVQEW